MVVLAEMETPYLNNTGASEDGAINNQGYSVGAPTLDYPDRVELPSNR
jgi:hypothetical protein